MRRDPTGFSRIDYQTLHFSMVEIDIQGSTVSIFSWCRMSVNQGSRSILIDDQLRSQSSNISLSFNAIKHKVIH